MIVYVGVTESGYLATRAYKRLEECKKVCNSCVGLHIAKFESIPLNKEEEKQLHNRK